MAEGKKNRYRYRQALKDRQLVRPTRFDDMMRALTGTKVCHWCGLSMPADPLHDLCASCLASRNRIRREVPGVTDAVRGRDDLEPGVIYVDASFRNGIAGLAVVGELGEHGKRIEAKTSTQAEVMALAWALEIAKPTERWNLVFRTDCQAAFRQLGWSRHELGWRIEQVPRHLNGYADYIADQSRRPDA